VSSKEQRRRKYERHFLRWKTAMIFDGPGGEPIVFHTETQDLSVGGAAVLSERDLAGAEVTLFLARPYHGLGEVEMIRMSAQVVSSAFMPNGTYRLGLRFLHADYDAQKKFAEELKAQADRKASGATSAPDALAAPAAPAVPPTPATMTTSGRLAALKQLAQAKQGEAPRDDSQEAINERVDAALRRAFDYLKELVENMNVVKPPFTKDYPLAFGVPPLDQLVWEKGQVDFRAKTVSSTSRLYEQVALTFRLNGRKQMEVTRENPAHEKFARTLTDNRIEYSKRETRNARGVVDKTTFTFPCEVNARVAMVANYQTGRIDLSARHVGRFGTIEHKVDPEAINDASLEELAGFILGESPTINLLLHKH
jgi:hypothetical protein